MRLRDLFVNFGGDRGDHRKIHWVRQKELCKPRVREEWVLRTQHYSTMPSQKNKLGGCSKTEIHFSIVFKSKFFPHYSFMEAIDSQPGSYAQRSILKGREVLKEGMRQRVGDGTSIWIWFDLWLPSDFLPYISSLAASEFEEAQVVSLIDPTTNEWNLATLLELFLPRDIALIKSIPLSCKSMEDKLY